MAESTRTKDVVVTRVFAAPVEKVWAAWTEPEQFMKWWGPQHFTSPSARMDVRVGGTFLWCMQSPDGQKFYTTGTFKEVVPNKRLVYTDAFADAEGNKVSPASMGMGDWPAEMIATVTFEKLADPPEGGGLTRLTIKHGPAPVGPGTDFAEAGWHQSLDKLQATLQ
jgi:uncharacterized protein YndB with AHSA1/START domain